jgi:malate synthase
VRGRFVSFFQVRLSEQRAQAGAEMLSMTKAMVEIGKLSVSEALVDFVEKEVLPGTDISSSAFWLGLESIYSTFSHENAQLLRVRNRIQEQLDGWYNTRANEPIDQKAYLRFLRSIGYLVEEPTPFIVSAENVDEELSVMSGPQLVVPISNARFLLNAANARWGSLYDALYGSDVVGTKLGAGGYDAERGEKVVDWAKCFLDKVVPLANGTWRDWAGGKLLLSDPALLIGRNGDNLLFQHNGLHIEVVIDRNHPIGRADPAGIADIILESAVSTICDLEDSVAAVDAADKIAAYRNWLGLMKGTLEDSFQKDGRMVTRRLNPDRTYMASNGSTFALSGRSLLLVRNVGLLMTTPAVRLHDGSEAPEGILDGVLTAVIALHDLKGRRSNSRRGSLYIVKPKMHGPDEAAFTDRLFDAIEDMLSLPRYTIKVGIMDEERRTSANLAACIFAVRNRIAFINTGFLDRTGDEIHTSMLAGPMVRKSEMKAADWIGAYEDRNVQIGLSCGLGGRAQIGKGMWAAPDMMADMIAQKIAHPQAGASTAWVPSPTAATLHATHYHAVNVSVRQAERSGEPVAPLERLLTLPLARGRNWKEDELREELDNNTQGILGYVVRWIDQGVGCSKVPDIHDVGLMEDRATLRISSQHIANWLLHGVVSADDVENSLRRMAVKVDRQNDGDRAYLPLISGEKVSLAFEAARSLIFEGRVQPNGYTEPLLHSYRARYKQQQAGGSPA